MPGNPDNDSLFLSVALFNTYLGLLNFDKNEAQHQKQQELENKLDAILAKLEKLERGLDNNEANVLQ